MHHPTDRITHTTALVTPVVEHWLEREIAQWVHPMKDRSDDPSHHERTLYLWATSRSSRCHYTKSNPIDDHSNISSKKLQKQNFKPLGHYTCMQCGTSHLQKVQENILSHIILATYRKFTVATVRFTQNVSCNMFTHPIYQQVANVTV